MTDRAQGWLATAVVISATLVVASTGGASPITSAAIGDSAASGLRPLLAYSSFQGGLNAINLTPNKLPDLFLITPDGKRAGRVSRTLAWEYQPAWAKNGKWIAYARGDELDIHGGGVQGAGPTSIWISKPDGSGMRRLTRPGGNRNDPPFDSNPTWSPGGNEIAFLRASISATIPAGIYTVQVQSGAVQRLAAGSWSALDWSPDGRTLAAVSVEGGLHIIAARTGRRVQTRRIRAGLVDFAPDGRSLAVAHGTGVFVLRLADGRTRRVVQARNVSSVSWSPTSRSIAFTAQGPRDADVFVVGTDGHGLRRLTSVAHDSGVSWRP